MKGAVLVGGFTAIALACAAGAQDVLLPGTAPTSIAQEKRALLTARLQSKLARDRSARLDRQARAATQDADRAQRRAAALAARIQESEADIVAAQARIAIIARLQAAQSARLAERQQPIVRLTAALQSLSRRPPALALVQPGSIDDAVHIRLVLGSVLPVIRQRTAGLRAELAQSHALRRIADQAAHALQDSRAKLASRQGELQRLETERRLASRALSSGAGLESDRALALGEKARDIADLMDRLEDAGAVNARLATLPGPLPRPARPGDSGLPETRSGVEQPPGAVAAGPPPYRLPVMGQLVTGLGEVSANGVRARGLTIATPANAQVVAPTSGRIAYAGHYRGYGQIVIIDHGQGWTTLITNLYRLSVEVGNTVVQGSPVGVAGSANPTITVELRRNGRPPAPHGAPVSGPPQRSADRHRAARGAVNR